jgi:hypothetical protein
MPKVYGARIYCRVCHAEPWPDDPATTRETFDLLRVDGDWLCEEHRTPKTVPKKSTRAPAGEAVRERKPLSE